MSKIVRNKIYILSFSILMMFIALKGFLSYASSPMPVIVDLDNSYAMTSEQVYQKAVQLVESHPYLLELEIIGYSVDQKPIYVIRMTHNIYMTDDYDYVEKSHLLIDAGVHARETVNPVLVLRMIEDYVLDYYNDDHLSGYNVKSLVQNSVLHFIPLVNPDGFDVAKYGTLTIDDPILRQTLSSLIPNLRPHRLKANIRGVDLNRNFEDMFYNTTNKMWVNQWGISNALDNPDSPSEDFYEGKEPGSETETQALMQYMLQYDFRAYVTYHSMGQVIYYWLDHLGNSYFYQNTEFALLAKSLTRYQMMPPNFREEYGYSTHYFANNTLKPALTLETTASYAFPTPSSYYKYEYYTHNLWAVPLAFLEKIKAVGYSDYKIYVDGIYVRDMINKEYAYEMAKKLDGDVHIYKGKPSYGLSKKVSVGLVDGTVLSQSIQTFDGRTFVSFKEIFEAQLFDISWRSEDNTSVAQRENEIVQIHLKTFETTVMGSDGIVKEIAWSSSPSVYNGRLMVPLSFVLEVLNLEGNDVNIVVTDEIVYKDF